ncbi:MarR family winged helix-turn-helix transcriptional regulator [Gorillibacterium timonense]|uniref:MarR family winged helix-turn-helix transcriptional regulator n=1 Tax=Gorillibacterium timonense TaxID=1689269 RepID=UPI00071D6263|nr:MarR family transcriptional regulator [Gorillibacterium timonense]
MTPQKQLFTSFLSLYRPYLNELNTLLAPMNLTSPLWSILYFLHRTGPQTAGDISEHQYVERPTVTKMLQRLHELGFIEAISGDDKRVKIIQLTDKGNDICQQVQEKLDLYQQELVRDIPEEEQRLVARILNTITKNITNGKG